MRVANCEGAVCVKSSVIQVLGDQGLCLYEVYRADECLGNSESKKVSYEGDCNLPGGEGCHDCETCTVPGIEEAIKLPVEFSSTPLGRRHHAKSELIDNGTAGDAVIEHEKPVGLPIEEDIIEIPGGRHAKLLWITLGPNDFIGIGYETDDNAVTIPEANVDLEPLNVGVGLHRSYSIVAAKQGENRHYVAFMR